MRSGRIKIYLAYLSVFIALSGCIERFDYSPDETGSPILVIDGGITNRQVKQMLRLSWSTKYGLVPFVPNTNAFVTIIENGITVDTCLEISDGTYQIDGDIIKPQPGKQYSVQVKTPGGKIYRSEPETMPDRVKPDSAYFEMERSQIRNDAGTYVEKWNINVYVNTPIPTQHSSSYLRWRVSEAYDFFELKASNLDVPKTCYMTKDITYQDIQLFNGEDLSGGYLEHKLVTTRTTEPTYEFTYVHYFNISQFCITRKAFEYWTRLKMVTNPTGSFIDTPPAAIIGNVHNLDDNAEVVLGYFEVSTEEIARVKTVPPGMLPYYAPNPCKYPFPNYCFDCLTFPNSSLIKPAYW